MLRCIVILLYLAIFISPDFSVFCSDLIKVRNPFESQVDENIAKLESPSAGIRAGAAESLGFLRAYRAAVPL